MGYCQSDFEDAAACVCWLESHGLDGMELLTQLPPQADAGMLVDIKVDISGTQYLDAHDTSVMFCGQMLADLACAIAADQGSATIEMRHCHDRKAILSTLVQCASRGLCAMAAWADKDKMCLASILAAHHAPDISYRSRSADSTTNSNLIIVCAKDRQVTDAVAATLIDSEAQTRTHMSAVDMEACYDATLRTGLQIDDDLIKKLTAQADTVLVEATEQSRRGAGE